MFRCRRLLVINGRASVCSRYLINAFRSNIWDHSESLKRFQCCLHMICLFAKRSLFVVIVFRLIAVHFQWLVYHRIFIWPTKTRVDFMKFVCFSMFLNICFSFKFQKLDCILDRRHPFAQLIWYGQFISQHFQHGFKIEENATLMPILLTIVKTRFLHYQYFPRLFKENNLNTG